MLAQAVQERERRLNEDYAEATPAALHRLTEQADHLSAETKALAGRLGAETCRDAIRAAREKTRELELAIRAICRLTPADYKIVNLRHTSNTFVEAVACLAVTTTTTSGVA
jgi:hypothetical protein